MVPPPKPSAPSSPAGSLNVVSRSPRRCPVAAAMAANRSRSPPAFSASAYAASFAETTSREVSASSSVQVLPSLHVDLHRGLAGGETADVDRAGDGQVLERHQRRQDLDGRGGEARRVLVARGHDRPGVAVDGHVGRRRLGGRRRRGRRWPDRAGGGRTGDEDGREDRRGEEGTARHRHRSGGAAIGAAQPGGSASCAHRG